MKVFKERKDELADLLSKLIRADTRNPPGNETNAATIIRDRLQSKGFKVDILERRKGRGNLIARLKGKGGPSLMMLSHLDVVPWDEEEWSKDPAGGEITKTHIWGRGAIDCKGLAVMEIAAFEELADRYGDELVGDLILVSSADEERGGEYGVEWLVKERWKQIECEFVINEGAGFTIPQEGGDVLTVQTSEKGILWLKLEIKGQSGHGSIPIDDNAILKGSKLLKKLSENRTDIRPTADARRFIRGAAGKSMKGRISSRFMTHPLTASRTIKLLKGRRPDLAAFMEAMLRDTITPTAVKGGDKENVIPSKFEIILDCRLLLGTDKEDIIDHIRRQGIEFSHEILKYHRATESSKDTSLYDSIKRISMKRKWCKNVLPLMLTGATDSRFLRERGSHCYGFQPMKTTSVEEIRRMIHGRDERISKENLALGADILYEVARDFLTQDAN